MSFLKCFCFQVNSSYGRYLILWLASNKNFQFFYLNTLPFCVPASVEEVKAVEESKEEDKPSVREEGDAQEISEEEPVKAAQEQPDEAPAQEPVKAPEEEQEKPKETPAKEEVKAPEEEVKSEEKAEPQVMVFTCKEIS